MVAAVRVPRPVVPRFFGTYEDAEIPRRAKARSRSSSMPVASISSMPISGWACIRPPSACPSRGQRKYRRSHGGRPGVTDIRSVIGWPTSARWAVSAERVVPGDRAVKLLENISYEQAAGMMLKGMTSCSISSIAHHKVGKAPSVPDTRCGRRRRPHRLPVGKLSWCGGYRHRRLKGKGRTAKKNGCHHTILYRDEDFLARVKEITSGSSVTWSTTASARAPSRLRSIACVLSAIS